MKTYYKDECVSLYNMKCEDGLDTMEENSVHAIVTDPPYGLAFMGKKWDYDVPSVVLWEKCLRVLKPGGHLLAFAGTRTQHRMAVRIEDAGFEIRDMIAWLYGSGFPKSMDVSKAMDKAAGVERERGPIDPIRAARLVNQQGDYETDSGWSAGGRSITIDPPATESARQWSGWGTALKPAMEPITVARKPFSGTVASNVMEWGTGAINIDACRVEPTGERLGGGGENRATFEKSDGWSRPWMSNPEHSAKHAEKVKANVDRATDLGRWPANIIHDGSDEVVELFPIAPGQQAAVSYKAPSQKTSNVYGKMSREGEASAARRYTERGSTDFAATPGARRNDSGSAARFFYCAKASKKERGEGNNHPTVKPLELMKYLVRLVCPKGGLVLDPFAGSGTTLLAATSQGFNAIGFEVDEGYCKIIESRIAKGFFE